MRMERVETLQPRRMNSSIWVIRFDKSSPPMRAAAVHDIDSLQCHAVTVPLLGLVRD